jgi:hypothetical protein
LQQIQEGKGIGGTAAEVEQGGECGQIHQQPGHQVAIAHFTAVAGAHQAHQIEQHQQANHSEHRCQWQVQVKQQAAEHNGEGLAENRQPAQLDQQQGIALAGGLAERVQQ